MDNNSLPKQAGRNEHKMKQFNSERGPKHSLL
jgi:hypothetical protein